VDSKDVRLPDDLAKRLLSRVDELAPLGSLLADAVDVGPEGRAALGEMAERLVNTYPFPDPHYAGQMLKPPHPVAWAAYSAAMLLNPNNHALDGGPATAAMEREVVADLAAMFGLGANLGHLAASGPIANLEEQWVARDLRPAKVLG
jgi:glutamate/tyrosine decarboxylase-like PLP-dependent enzyme